MTTSGKVNRYHTPALVVGKRCRAVLEHVAGMEGASHSSFFCAMLPGADYVEWACLLYALTPCPPSPRSYPVQLEIGRFRAAGPECCRLFWCLAASIALARREDCLLSLPYIGLCPWPPVSITATTTASSPPPPASAPTKDAAAPASSSPANYC
jgi:hypothetical protein